VAGGRARAPAGARRGGRPRAAGEAFAAAVAGYEAVELFVERARAVQPGFALTARTAPAVAAICARLDGLPLALELAAAQVATLGVEQLAARLDDVFAVLTRGRRTALPRHRTLRALLDWSYHLLAPAERALLARLSVFRGAFTLEASRRVRARPPTPRRGRRDAPATLAALGRLVEQSLVDVRERAGGRRDALPAARDGAAVRARPPRRRPDEERARARGTPPGWPRARPPGPARGARRAGAPCAARARRADEIRAALDWAAGPGDPMTAVRIAGALAWFWFSGVPWPEARARTAAALAAADAQGFPTPRARPPTRPRSPSCSTRSRGSPSSPASPTRMLALSARARRCGTPWTPRARRPGARPRARHAAVRGRATMRGMAGLAHAMLGAPTSRSRDERGRRHRPRRRRPRGGTP
jgi:hypothetical protein